MKTTGIGLVIFGCLAGLFGISIDTTVPVEYTDEQRRVLGIYGERRVHNLSLANQQRNWLGLAAVLAVMGTGLLIAGSQGSGKSGSNSNGRGMRKCHACAEMVLREAKICRYCSTELEPIPEPDRPPPSWGKVMCEQCGTNNYPESAQCLNCKSPL